MADHHKRWKLAVVAIAAKDFAKEQQGLAEQRLADADQQRSLAEKNFQLAFDAVDQMLAVLR